MNLKHVYSRDEFVNFLKHEFLPDFDSDVRDIHISNKTKTIQSAKYLGECRDLGLQIFELKTSGKSEKKISQALDSFKILREFQSYKALVAYYSEDDQNWRLAFLQMTPNLTDKGKITNKYSNPRRYSFLLGPNAQVKTPEKYLIKDGHVKDFEDLQKRFSVEVVNKDFYREVARFFSRLVGGDTKLKSKTEHFQSELVLPSVDVNNHRVFQEYTVRLIGRIIFCWFLKQKKSTEDISLLPEEFLSSMAVENNSNYYHAVLEPIFFEILNKPRETRKPQFRNGYDRIPYLNGGLFDPHLDDFYEGQPNYALKIPDSWFKELFDILETYNFTIDENTALDVDLSIDPEMLGRIFENLLAEINPETGESARKSTGSYYTPRQIVEYMVDQSLIQYLITKTEIDEDKIKALVSVDTEDDGIYPLDNEEKQKIVNALNEVKIIDPACGSGAFPIGILQKIVWMLGKVDTNGQLWFDKKLENLDPLLHEDFKAKFENENFDYIRKTGVIRDSIYGVDIQSIAVEVSKLRCFLTLIVDEDIDEKKDNRGIKPLPNLEFKFVAANSLINLPGSSTSNKGQTTLFEEDDEIKQLKKLRDVYFVSNGYEKEKVKNRFKDVQKEMFKKQISKSGAGTMTMALADWDPFANKVSGWFDPEWMFGIKNFDISIANPPYLDSEKMTISDKDLREKYASLYQSAKGNWDLFIIFIEKGIKLLNEKGIITYIVPNKLIASKYSAEIRRILQERQLSEIRDYSNIKVFLEADVYPVVFVASNNKKSLSTKTFVMKNFTEFLYENIIDQQLFDKDIFWDKFFFPPEKLNIILKISQFPILESYGLKVLGSATVGEAYEIKEYLKEYSGESILGYKKFINTGTIDPYISLWDKSSTQYIKQKYNRPIIKINDIESINRTRLTQANSAKIIIAGMTKRLECFYDCGEYLSGKSTTIIMPGKIDLKALAAILNSNLISFWYQIYFNSLSLSGGYLQISQTTIKEIPIPEIDEENLNVLAHLVDSIKENYENATQIKKEIDRIVYKLYDLTPEEIETIENHGS